MKFTSFNRSGSAEAPAAFASQSMTDRKAQYAAWKERMMDRTRDDEVIDVADERPSPWSVESLFTDG